jgi:acyl-CoA thioester hydrolase
MENFHYETGIEIRFADLDAYGHVNNAVIFSYLETARVKMFRDHCGNFLAGGLLFLVARAECDYRKPIELEDRLVVAINLERLGRTSFTLTYRLHNGGDTVFAEAKTVMVCFDPQRKQPAAVPAELTVVFGHSG